MKRSASGVTIQSGLALDLPGDADTFVYSLFGEGSVDGEGENQGFSDAAASTW